MGIQLFLHHLWKSVINYYTNFFWYFVNNQLFIYVWI